MSLTIVQSAWLITAGVLGFARLANIRHRLFLAGPDASYITGATLMTDGGMTIQLISKARYASKALEGR